MALLSMSSFKGEIPRLADRVLPPNFAQIARNVTFDNGALTPLRTTAVVNTFGSDAVSIYLLDTTWLSWTSVVDVARAPVAANRIYYTGDGVPKVRNSGTVYDLALAAPTGAPTLTNLSGTDPELLEDVYYAYTYVTSLGEESQPSPLSALLSTSPGVTVRVSGLPTTSTRAITGKRIYRSKTSAAGTTDLYFVASVSAATTTYDHVATTLLAEPIPSTDYDPPPAGLSGLIAMPNGMMAAFSGYDVYFCEPYQPHAWPQKYVMTVNHAIVGLAAFGSNLAVLTNAAPYIMQGTHPDSMVSDKMEKSLPCMSRRGIVDIGYAALYPSADGLAMISPNDAKVISENLFTREQWSNMVPDSMSAARFNGKYLFMRSVVSFDTRLGSGATDWVSADNLLGDNVSLPAGTVTMNGGKALSSFGEQQLGIIDYEGQDPFFCETDIEKPVAMMTNQATAGVFMLRADNRTVVEWEERNANPAISTWRSRLNSSAVPMHFGVAFIRTSIGVTTEDVFECRVISDGVVVGTVTKANTIVRLPATGPAREWEVEIMSNVEVVSVQIASTVDELLVA